MTQRHLISHAGFDPAPGVAAVTMVAAADYDALAARLAEEVENAATYKQERDEIVVNYQTVAARLAFIDAERDALRADAERLRKGLQAVADLIAESHGVYGLHLNGDPSPWSELQTGGRFEEWLADFDAARGKP